MLGSFVAQHATLRAFVESHFRMVDIQTIEWDHLGAPVRVLTNLVGIVERGRLVGLWGAQRALDREARLDHAPRALSREPSEQVTITDREGRILFESPAMERVLGHEDAARQGLDVFAGVHPDDTAGLREVFAQAGIAASGSTAVVPVRLRHKSGRYLARAAVVHHVADVPGPPLLALSVFDLPSALPDRVECPRPSPDESGMSLRRTIHQLNNLLTVITGHAQLALRRANKDEALAHDMQTIVDAARRACGVIDGLEPWREGSRTAARTQDGTDGDGRRCRTA
jgi:PAS domain S-box-containing protein